MKKPKYCQDKRHHGLKVKGLELYTHSTVLYYPELFAKTGQLSYWACESCVSLDHKIFARLGREKIMKKNQKIIDKHRFMVRL